MIYRINGIFEELIKLCDKNSHEMPIAALLIKYKDFFNNDFSRAIWATNKRFIHAEIVCSEGMWSLEEYMIFCTLEPCPSCLWFLIDKKIRYILYGTSSDLYKTNSKNILNHLNITNKTDFFYGFKVNEIKYLLKQFFKRNIEL